MTGRNLGKFTAAFAVVVTMGIGAAWAQCTTIQGGALAASTGEPLELGYDYYGYNYEAHMFNGDYCDYRRGIPVCPTVDMGNPINEPGDVDLMMKWNDAWLSNKSCDGDAYLDRHFGNDDYKGSGAWLTNQMSGKVEVGGRWRKWTYFVKIVAVPTDAYMAGDLWKTAEGTTIGPAIWGPFAVVQEVSNDPSKGQHGILYNSPAHPGLGEY